MENFIQMLGNLWEWPLTKRNAGNEGYLWHSWSVVEIILGALAHCFPNKDQGLPNELSDSVCQAILVLYEL